MKLDRRMILFLIFTATLYFSPIILVYLIDPDLFTPDTITFLIFCSVLFFIIDLDAGLPVLGQTASIVFE
jgi:hypothetical protein